MLDIVPMESAVLPATDGRCLFCAPDWIMEDRKKRGNALCMAIAHCTAHCLLGHVFDVQKDALIADLAVALLLDRILPEFAPAHESTLFQEAKWRLNGVPLHRLSEAIKVQEFFTIHREALTQCLRVDDHTHWGEKCAGVAKAGGDNGAEWISRGKQLIGSGNGKRAGHTAGETCLRVRYVRTPERSYGALLRQYAQEREFPREDMDTFQHAWYAYGLEHYGNVALIEPNETREEKRIDELVIAIDTSGSCIEELVFHFLEEMRAILADKTLFFPRFQLHIIQFDAKVHTDDRITDVREFERYMSGLEIVGGGGTDFRPAFAHIDSIIARGGFRHLQAALFLSDGLGIFPSQEPKYDTIFLCYKEHFDAIDFPVWVRKVILDMPNDYREARN